MLKLPENSNVLVLAAHPDDETLGCGSSLCRLSDAGNKIHLMTFTDGVDARDTIGSQNRNHNLGTISSILGIHSFNHGEFPDNSMDVVPLLKLCKYIEKNCPFSPDLIFTHHPSCLNIDHQLVYQATMTAFRPQFGQEHTILSYFVPSSTDYNPSADFKGNMYINAAGYVDKKLKALRVYSEEMRDYPHSRSYKNIKNLMRCWGSEVGLEYAEKFQLMRQVV